MKCRKCNFGFFTSSKPSVEFKMKSLFSLVFKCIVLWLFLFQGSRAKLDRNSTFQFVERCRVDCARQNDSVVCGRYRMVRWLNDVREKEFSFGPIRIVRIPSIKGGTFLPKVPRAFVLGTNKSSGIAETLSFIRETLEDMLTKRAFVYTIDQQPGARHFSTGPMIVDEDELNDMKLGKTRGNDWRLFKKKKQLILPVLILLNLVKIKLLLLPILLGIHFIKKLLLLASFIAPSILSHLKICKTPQQPTYPHHLWATAAEAPADYPTGYGHEDPSWMHRNDLQGAYGHHNGYQSPYGGYYQRHRR